MPSTKYSREAGDPVSGATGSMDSLLADTVKVQPSGVFNTPGGADGIGPAGPPGGGGAASAAGTTTGSAGGSARANGAAAVGTSMQTAAKVAKRINMLRWRLSLCESLCEFPRDLSGGQINGLGVQTV